MSQNDERSEPGALAENVSESSSATFESVQSSRERLASLQRPHDAATAELVIDEVGREVSLRGERVPLTHKEFSLLVYLHSHRGRVLSRRELLADVWGTPDESRPRRVDVCVRRLRAKLGKALPLETRRGFGYKLNER